MSKCSVQTQSINKTRPQNALNIAKKTAPKIAPNNYNSFLSTVEKFCTNLKMKIKEKKCIKNIYPCSICTGCPVDFYLSDRNGDLRLVQMTS